MCDIVWASPQEHWSESESFHFFLQAPQWPCPVRKRFRRGHCCRGRAKPGCRIVGSSTRCALTTASIVNPSYCFGGWQERRAVSELSTFVAVPKAPLGGTFGWSGVQFGKQSFACCILEVFIIFVWISEFIQTRRTCLKWWHHCVSSTFRFNHVHSSLHRLPAFRFSWKPTSCKAHIMIVRFGNENSQFSGRQSRSQSNAGLCYVTTANDELCIKYCFRQ